MRDTLLLKDPKRTHISEAYRYYAEPFGAAPDPERVEAEWRAGKFQTEPWHHGLSLSMLRQRMWMRLLTRNTGPQRPHFLWNIFNFSDSAALHCRRQGKRTFTQLGAASS